MTEPKKGCAPPARGPIVSNSETDGLSAITDGGNHGSERTGGTKMHARVGHPAPDFEVTAFHEGGFKNVKLSNYAGKWVVLCFYPGDFTFV